MPNRFFIRFNLQNSVGFFPATAAVGAAMKQASCEEMQGYLDEFDTILRARADRLHQKLGNTVSPLCGKRVLFLGDSNTSDNLGYRRSVCQVAGMIGIDASISGGTSATALPLAFEKLPKEAPDLVSVMIGSNDAVCLGSSELGQVSLAEYERNLRAILSRADQAGARILIMALPSVFQAGFDRYNPILGRSFTMETISRYNAVLASVAKEFGAHPLAHDYIPAEDDLSEWTERDGVHLNLRAHEALAERWLMAASRLF